MVAIQPHSFVLQLLQLWREINISASTERSIVKPEICQHKQETRGVEKTLKRGQWRSAPSMLARIATE